MSVFSKNDFCILVVDDFSTMRRIILVLLRELGFTKFMEAENGDDALKLLGESARTDSINFVVTDVNMPGMNGFELLKKVRDDSRFAAVPILIVTAEARKEDIVLAAKWGADGYIVKPFTKATLEERVTRILQKKGISFLENTS